MFILLLFFVILLKLTLNLNFPNSTLVIYTTVFLDNSSDLNLNFTNQIFFEIKGSIILGSQFYLIISNTNITIKSTEYCFVINENSSLVLKNITIKGSNFYNDKLIISRNSLLIELFKIKIENISGNNLNFIEIINCAEPILLNNVIIINSLFVLNSFLFSENNVLLIIDLIMLKIKLNFSTFFIINGFSNKNTYIFSNINFNSIYFDNSYFISVKSDIELLNLSCFKIENYFNNKNENIEYFFYQKNDKIYKLIINNFIICNVKKILLFYLNNIDIGNIDNILFEKNDNSNFLFLKNSNTLKMKNITIIFNNITNNYKLYNEIFISINGFQTLIFINIYFQFNIFYYIYEKQIIIIQNIEQLQYQSCVKIENLIIENNYFNNKLILYFLRINSNSKTYLINTLITNNSLVQNPVFFTLYMISIENVENKLYINNILFNNNNFSSKCKLMSFNGYSSNCNSLIFKNNIASSLVINSKLVKIQNISIINNKGTSILFTNSLPYEHQEFNVIFLFIFSNIAEQSSVFFLDSSLLISTIIFNYSIIQNNTVSFYGPILIITESYLNLFFSQTYFMENSGQMGGAICSMNIKGILTINESYFILNTVLRINSFFGAGAILLYGSLLESKIYVNNSYFILNKALKSGGAILNAFGIFIILNTIFYENTAFKGGSISSIMVALTICDSLQIRNKNKDLINGGAIYLEEGAYLSLTTSLIENCYASFGGAIYLDGDRLSVNIENVIFKNNSAFNNGNTIYGFCGNLFMLKINNCSFIENYHKKNEMFYFYQSKILFMNCIIKNNYATVFNYVFNIDILISVLVIYNHSCFVSQQGCLFNFLDNSKGSLINLKLNNIIDYYYEKLFLIHFSSFEIIIFIITEFNNNNLGQNIFESENSIILLQNIVVLNSNKNFFNSKNNDYIEIKSCFFYNFQNSAITSILNPNFVNISSNIFLEIYKKEKSAVEISDLNENNKKILVLLIKNKFFKIYSLDGACLKLQNLNLLIFLSIFIENLSLNKGGSIYLYSELDSLIFWEISNNIFIKNTAKQGGAIYSLYNIPSENSNEYQLNSALYGDNFASIPFQMNILINKTNYDCDINNSYCYLNKIISGSIIPSIQIIIVDKYGQLMRLENGYLELLISSYSDRTYLNSSLFPLINGICNIQWLKIITTPQNTIFLNIYYNNLNYFLRNNSLFHLFDSERKKYFLQMSLNIRECISGEIYIYHLNICYKCQKNTYSFNPNNPICYDCPKNCECLGGNIISVNHEFWRETNFSIKIFKCELPNICLGGINSECANEYYGFLCSSCKKNYFRNYLNSCVSCENWIYSLLISFSIIIVIVGIILIFLHFDKSEGSDEFILMKIFTNYIQFISFLPEISNSLIDKFEFRKIDLIYFYYFFNFGFNINGMNDYFSCFNYIKMLEFYKILFIESIIFCTILFFLCYFLNLFIIKMIKRLRRILHNANNNVFIIIIYLIQPNFIKFYLKLLNCLNYDSEKRISVDLSNLCWTSNHLFFSALIVIPILLIWMLSFPILFFYLKFKLKKKISLVNSENLKSTFFLKFFSGYKNNFNYWDLILMIKKYIALIILTFMKDKILICYFQLIVLNIFFMIIQIKIQPFKDKFNNILENLASNSILICIFFLAIIEFDINDILINICFVICIIGLLSFLIPWSILYLSYKNEKIRKNISLVFFYLKKIIFWKNSKKIGKKKKSSIKKFQEKIGKELNNKFFNDSKMKIIFNSSSISLNTLIKNDDQIKHDSKT